MDPDALARLRREHFGFIFQRYQLLGDLSALGNVEIPAIYAGTPAAERHARSERLLARLGLAESAVANWGARLDGLIEDGKFLVPTAIRLHRAIAYRLASLRPSRHLVFKRDKHTCQYCGRRSGPLTLDHVMPASRGGEDTWENLVAACGACNQFKANRTPEEAGMRLASQPRRYVASFNWEIMDKLCLA